MFGNSALDYMEDSFIVTKLVEGSIAKAEARGAVESAEAMRRGVAKIEELRGVIQNLQQQLKAADQRAAEAEARAKKAQENLASLREQNNESVAVANGTAMALKDAVEQLQAFKDEPKDQVADQYLRKVRTHHYNQQVNKLLAQGHLTKDPRVTGVAEQRQWFVKELERHPEVAQ